LPQARQGARRLLGQRELSITEGLVRRTGGTGSTCTNSMAWGREGKPRNAGRKKDNMDRERERMKSTHSCSHWGRGILE